MEKEKCKCKEDPKEKCTCEENCECENQCNCESECTCESDCTCTEEENCGCGGKCNHEKETKKEKKKKDKHEDKLNEAYNKINELEDKLLREKAELVNYRKRKEEETSRMLMYSNENLAKSLLPIVDNFERAINMDDDNLEDEVSKFLSGFKMIYCNLISTLEKYDIKSIDETNIPFDPTYHQAIMTEKKDGVEPEMVIEVLQKGYLLKDKVIRPAMVKVSE
jgi:molecular chaperone GrpE